MKIFAFGNFCLSLWYVISFDIVSFTKKSILFIKYTVLKQKQKKNVLPVKILLTYLILLECVKGTR